MDIGSVSAQIMFVAALVWGITQVLKQVLAGVPPQLLCFVVALVLGVTAYLTGYLTGNPFEQVGQVILTALSAIGIHNYLYKSQAPGGGAA